MVPVHLPLGAVGEVLAGDDAVEVAAIVVVALAVPHVVFAYGVEAVEDVFDALLATVACSGIIFFDEASLVTVIV